MLFKERGLKTAHLSHCLTPKLLQYLLVFFLLGSHSSLKNIFKTFQPVWQKWAQYYKAIILQLKLNKLGEKKEQKIGVRMLLLLLSRFSRVRLVTPCTAAYQAPPSMGSFQARVLEWVAIAFSGVIMIALKYKNSIRSRLIQCSGFSLSFLWAFPVTVDTAALPPSHGNWTTRHLSLMSLGSFSSSFPFLIHSHSLHFPSFHHLPFSFS